MKPAHFFIAALALMIFGLPFYYFLHLVLDLSPMASHLWTNTFLIGIAMAGQIAYESATKAQYEIEMLEDSISELGVEVETIKEKMDELRGEREL